MFASSSDEESKEGGLHCVLVGNFKPIGYKQDCKRKVFASIREDCKRRKEDLDDPTYVPEVPKDGKKKSDTTSKKKSAGLGVVRFVFIFFSIEIIYYLISIIFDESSNIWNRLLYNFIWTYFPFHISYLVSFIDPHRMIVLLDQPMVWLL